MIQLLPFDQRVSEIMRKIDAGEYTQSFSTDAIIIPLRYPGRRTLTLILTGLERKAAANLRGLVRKKLEELDEEWRKTVP